MKSVKHVNKKEMKLIIIAKPVKMVIFLKKEIVLNVSIILILMIMEIIYALVLLILNAKNVQKKILKMIYVFHVIMKEDFIHY